MIRYEVRKSTCCRTTSAFPIQLHTYIKSLLICCIAYRWSDPQHTSICTTPVPCFTYSSQHVDNSPRLFSRASSARASLLAPNTLAYLLPSSNHSFAPSLKGTSSHAWSNPQLLVQCGAPASTESMAICPIFLHASPLMMKPGLSSYGWHDFWPLASALMTLLA